MKGIINFGFTFDVQYESDIMSLPCLSEIKCCLKSDVAFLLSFLA